MKAGRYFIVVAWAETHIPGSPFKLRVHPAADASKVKAYGPGLKDGFLGDTGQFKIETKNAGIGTLLIRVHGIKDTFKIEAMWREFGCRADHSSALLSAKLVQGHSWMQECAV